MKSLVVYYSRTGNAKFVAQTIATEIGADMEEIVDKKSRSGPVGWLSGGRDARKGAETEIAQTKKSAADYDLIIVGTPNWASRITPAVLTYLKKNSLAEKKVAAFIVQGGDKPFPAEQIKGLVPDAVWAGDISISKALENKVETEKQVVAWCQKLTGKASSQNVDDAFTKGL